MILVYLDKKDAKYSTIYFNLKKRSAYKLYYNEFNEVAIEVPLIFDEEVVKELVIKELEANENYLKSLTSIVALPGASYEDKSEYLRISQNIHFLIHYDL